MNRILAIETATQVCSVALFEEGIVIDSIETSGSYTHAENLAVFCETLLKRNALEAIDLSAVAVGKGPGSYTGLRIGVAFAKGLCFAHELPLIAIDTLKSLAFAARELIEDPVYYICPMIDARRMEVYTSLYDEQLNTIQEIEAKLIDGQSFESYLDKKPIYFLGNGAAKCREIIEGVHANFNLEIENSARYMGSQIMEKYGRADFEDLAYFEPYYLKEFIALKSKKGKLN